jgi:hypothetical protein
VIIFSPIIEELWILTQDAQVIAKYNRKNQINDKQLSNFYLVLKSVMKEFSEHKLQSFKLGSNKYTCVSCCNDLLILISRTSPSAKEKRIDKLFKVIGEIIENLYSSDDIRNWNGEVSFFYDLNNKLENYFNLSDL